MNLWLCAHIQLFTAAASRSFYPVWDKIYICGWDHYKSFMHQECNFKCLQAWRTRPKRYLLYSMDYGSCITSKIKKLSKPNPNIELCNQHLNLTEERMFYDGAKLWLCGYCFKILSLCFFHLKKITTLSLMTTFPDVPYGHLTEFSEKRVEKEQFLCIRISWVLLEWGKWGQHRAAGGPFLIVVWGLDPELALSLKSKCLRRCRHLEET